MVPTSDRTKGEKRGKSTSDQVGYLFENILKGDATCVGLDAARPSHLLFKKKVVLSRWCAVVLGPDGLASRCDTFGHMILAWS